MQNSNVDDMDWVEGRLYSTSTNTIQEITQVADEDASHNLAIREFERLIGEAKEDEKGDFMGSFSTFTQDYFIGQKAKQYTNEQMIALLFSQVSKLTETVNSLVNDLKKKDLLLKKMGYLDEQNLLKPIPKIPRRTFKNNHRKKQAEDKIHIEKQHKWKHDNKDETNRDLIYKRNLCNNCENSDNHTRSKCPRFGLDQVIYKPHKMHKTGILLSY